MHYLINKIKSEKVNILSIATTSGVSIISSFIMMLAFANLLDQRSLGIYQYIIASANIIAAFSFTGTGTAIIRAVSKKSYSFLITARRYILLGSFIPITIVTISSGYYVYKGNYALAVGIFFSVICILLTHLLMRYNFIYVAIERFKESNYLLKAHAIAPVIFVLPALFFISHPSILAILYSGGSLLAILLIAIILKMPLQERNLISQIKEIKETKEHNSLYLRFASHQSVITLLNTATVHFDKVLIFQMLGAQQTAMYFVAISIPDRLRSLIKQFGPYLFSKFAKHSAHAIRKTMSLKLMIMFASIIPFFVLYVMLAPLFFDIFLSQYKEIVHLSVIYALTLFAGTLIIPESSLHAHASSKVFYTLSIVYGLIRISLLLIGIYTFGLLGAIYAATISLLLYLIMYYVAALNH